MTITLDGMTPPPAANLVKDSTDQTFMVDVLEASKQVPVLVDFWAPWCGPCKQLGPAIEKVVREQQGKVKLVKINIDENPTIAGQLRVQSIPAVFAFVDGRPVDGFMGALPESQIKQFISKLTKMGSMADQISEALGMARQALETGDHEAAADIASQVIQADRTQAEAYAIRMRSEIAMEQLDLAQETLKLVPGDKLADPHVVSAKAALELALNPVDTSGIGKFEDAIAKNPKDHEARIELARLLNGSGNRDAATDHLIHIVKSDRTWNEDAARKLLIEFFEAWGPKDEATLSGRRKLSAVLFR
jgi:putative thioredoxin